MKLLITGGYGFQGHHVSAFWARAGHQVAVLNTPTRRAQANADRLSTFGVVPVWGSVTEPEVVEKAVDGRDVVVHLAAWSSVDAANEHPIAALQVNVMGTYRVLEAVRRRGIRVITASSVEVYGASTDGEPQSESAPLNPQSPYAASKAAADRLCHAYHRTYGVNVTVLRPSNVYGPGQRAGATGAVIPIFVDAVKNGQPMLVRGDGQQSREYLHVSDLIRGYDAVLRHEGLAGETINLGSGEIVSIAAIARAIQAEVGGEIQHVEARPGEVAGFRLDSAKALRLIGWAPEVKFHDGLKALCRATMRESSPSVRGSWRGFFALHRPEDFPVIAAALREVRPSHAVELGTAAGGFAAFLADTLAEWGGQVLTVDVKRDSVPPEPGYEDSTVDRLIATTPNLTFLEADALTVPHTIITRWIRNPGAFLYADDGDKERELRLYAPFIGPGGMIGCHDYGSEVDPEIAAEIMAANGFEPFHHAECEALANKDYPMSMTRFWKRP